MMNYRELYAILLSVVIALGGCTKPYTEEVAEIVVAQDTELRIPFATDNELLSLRSDDQTVDWQLSRKIALLEMENFREVLYDLSNSTEYRISEYPVIVFEADRVTPKFYEFIIYDGNNVPIATVTNFAKKEVTAFSACFLPFLRDYTNEYAQMFSDIYPNIDTLQITSLKSNQDETKCSIVSQQVIDDFWKNIEREKATLISKSDDEVAKLAQSELRGTEWHTIPAFKNENLQRTIFDADCGPAAAAWLYRGLYTHFLGEYIPIHTEPRNYPNYNYSTNKEKEKDPKKHRTYYLDSPYRKCRILEVFSNYTGIRGVDREKLRELYGEDGKATPDDFPDLRSKEKKKGKIDDLKNSPLLTGSFAEIINHYFEDHEPVFLHSIKGAPRRAIQRNNPVALVVAGKAKDFGSMHYLVGFGTKDKYGWFGIHYDSWILVMDNGYMIADHDNLPYYRSSNFFALGNKHFACIEIRKK